MAKNRVNSRFRHGTVICWNCGKVTRDTGWGENSLQMCKNCIEAQEWANGITDGTYTLEDIAIKKRELVKKFL